MGAKVPTPAPMGPKPLPSPPPPPPKGAKFAGPDWPVWSIYVPVRTHPPSRTGFYLSFRAATKSEVRAVAKKYLRLKTRLPLGTEVRRLVYARAPLAINR